MGTRHRVDRVSRVAKISAPSFNERRMHMSSRNLSPSRSLASKTHRRQVTALLLASAVLALLALTLAVHLEYVARAQNLGSPSQLCQISVRSRVIRGSSL